MWVCHDLCIYRVQFSLCLRLQYSIYYFFDSIQFYFLQCGASVPMSFTCTASWSGSTHSRFTSSVRCADKSGSSKSEDGDSSKDSSADSSADSATVKDNSRIRWTNVRKLSLPFGKTIYQEEDEKLALYRTIWMFDLVERDSHIWNASRARDKSGSWTRNWHLISLPRCYSYHASPELRETLIWNASRA